MKDKEKLEKVLAYTSGELSRSDAKFRNLGTVNSLLIGSFVAIILYALKYESGTGKITALSICGFFLAMNAISVAICLYGIWPKEKNIHGAFDPRFTAKKYYLKEMDESYLSDRRLRFNIEINSGDIVKKRKLLIVGISFTLFPISIFMAIVVRKNNEKSRTRYKEFTSLIEAKKARTTKQNTKK